jgi:hypothetical protein
MTHHLHSNAAMPVHRRATHRVAGVSAWEGVLEQVSVL